MPKALRPSKKALLGVTENAPDVICRFDKSFRLLYVNPAIESATGIPPNAFVNKTTRELGMPEEHSVHWEKHITSVFLSGSQTTMEFPFLTPRAGLRFFQAILVPEFGKGGMVETVLTISRDITEQKEIERKKEESVSMVSHELKTPVTALKISTQFLQRKFEKEGEFTVAAQLETMDKQIDKLTNIIENLMDTTRLEKGSMQLQKERVNFNELVRDTVDEVQKTSSLHVIEVQGSAKQAILADKLRISQVLTNLLSNAIRYSPDSAKISVGVRHYARALVCSVADSGVGIKSEHIEKVFERFYRVEDNAHAKYLGLGLGLYISKEIVKLHGGKIWAKSTYGKGTTFFFSLPTQ